MAGRIRTIKPEILDDERTACLSHDAWRLFVSMILLADDYGNLRARGAQLGAVVFWGRAPSRTVDDLLEELAKLDDDGSPGLVTLYSVGSERFAHLNGWTKNQRVDKPGKPRVPRPTEGKVAEPKSDPRVATGLFDRTNGAKPPHGPISAKTHESVDETENSRESRETPALDLRSPITDHRSPISEEDPDARGRTHAHTRVAGPVPIGALLPSSSKEFSRGSKS